MVNCKTVTACIFVVSFLPPWFGHGVSFVACSFSAWFILELTRDLAYALLIGRLETFSKYEPRCTQDTPTPGLSVPPGVQDKMVR